MADTFLGQISMFGFNFAPKGWALCNGQTLPIQQNAALFSILGTTYGGDGITTFQLPNLQSRTLMGTGQGLGLSRYDLGQVGGVESHALTVNELPIHTHLLQASNAVPTGTPATNSQFAAPAQVPLYRSGNATTFPNPASIAFNGGSQPHTNVQPSLTINFCIALVGIFPSRN